MITDAFGALAAVILADANVAALVAARVYINEIPPGVLAGMPQKVILLRQAGGSGTDGELQLQDLTIDVFCYGRNSQEAEQVRRTLYPVLKYMRRLVQNGVLIHACNPVSGPAMAHEPEGALPVIVQSWDCLVSEVQAA